MQCVKIDESLVGCAVEIDLKSGKLEGKVRSVDSTGSKVTIIEGFLLPSKTPLPPIYRVFIKEILKVTVTAGGNGPVIKPQAPPPPLVPLISQVIAKPAQFNKPRPLVVSSKGRKKSSVMVPKFLPAHIQTLNNNLDTDVLTNKVPQLTRRGRSVVTLNIPEYQVIEHIDEVYEEAIETLKKEKRVGLSMEGVRVSRSGVVCWLGMATKEFAYLFDICSLGPPGFQYGLTEILEDPKIMKVVHDCRFLSDALLHQYNIKLLYVFDTQVAAACVDLKKNSVFDRFVKSLNRCLTDYMNFPSDSLFCPRTREGFETEDEARWKMRPLPQHLLEGAVFNVCHLLNLRKALTGVLLSEVSRGTELYMGEITSLDAHAVPEKIAHSHLIPMTFKELVPSHQRRNGVSAFQPTAPLKGVDPYVNFTRHMQHVRKFSK